MRHTPWGKADRREKLCYGVTFYSTPSHGGYFVAKTVRKKMPPRCQNEDGWYEEDLEWCKVAAAFPQHFTPAIVDIANSLLEKFFDQSGNYKHGT